MAYQSHRAVDTPLYDLKDSNNQRLLRKRINPAGPGVETVSGIMSARRALGLALRGYRLPGKLTLSKDAGCAMLLQLGPRCVRFALRFQRARTLPGPRDHRIF